MNNFELPIGKEKIDKWNALPFNYKPNDLIDIPLNYRAAGCENKDMKLRKEALESLIQLVDEAENQDIIIRCISAFRSAEYQDMLYKKACLKEGEDQQSTAKPCYSEHQLGTVVDVSCPEIDFGLKECFSDTKSYDWILNNAHRFSFYLSYTKENHKEKGYIWEPWHLRYWGSFIPES